MLQFQFHYEITVLLGLFLSFAFTRTGIAGRTSTYIRSEWPSSDIPLNNDVFAIPNGHNAPQQVLNTNTIPKFKLNPRKVVIAILIFNFFLVVGSYYSGRLWGKGCNNLMGYSWWSRFKPSTVRHIGGELWFKCSGNCDQLYLL